MHCCFQSRHWFVHMRSEHKTFGHVHCALFNYIKTSSYIRSSCRWVRKHNDIQTNFRTRRARVTINFIIIITIIIIIYSFRKGRYKCIHSERFDPIFVGAYTNSCIHIYILYTTVRIFSVVMFSSARYVVIISPPKRPLRVSASASRQHVGEEKTVVCAALRKSVRNFRPVTPRGRAVRGR